MRTSSIVKMTAGFFLVPLALGSAGYYFVRPMVEVKSEEPKVTAKADVGEKVSKRFSPPKVEVNTARAVTRRRGIVIGRKPRARPKVQKEETTAPVSQPTGPDMGGGAPPTVPDTGPSPVDGG